MTIDKHPLMLVSATRLSRIKGKNRMIKLANALDRAEIDYIWYVFTDDTNAIDSPNVFYMKPRLDVYKWLAHADYLVQLSDTEACSYSINEALYRNIPVIVTPLPYLKEIGVEDGKNAWLMNFDCSNIDYIVKNITNIPKFKFKHLEDNYSNLFVKSKSYYKNDENYTKVIAIETFSFKRFRKLKNITRANNFNNEWGEIYKGDIFDCPNNLLDYLLGIGTDLKPVVEVYNG